MSSPDRSRRALLGLVLAGMLPLGGCFRPLYGEASIGGGTVEAALQDIVVEPLPDRIGHYVVQELGYALNGSGAERKARYKLAMTLRERVQASIVNTSTGTADAAAILVDVDFKIIKIEDDAKVMEGKAFATASYDRNGQRFAANRAARDAEIRIAKNLADQLRTRIATRFATGA